MIPTGAFFLSFLLSLGLVPGVRWLSFKTGKIARPRKDRWHNRPTPTLGGIGIYLAFMAAVLAASAISGDWLQARWELLAGAALIFGLGLWDDFRPLSPPAKMVGQILAAAIIVSSGRVIDFFPWGFANVILTFFWLVGITNAINLLDNMDGLAGGIAAIAAGFLAYFFWTGDSPFLMLVSLALAGSILGFLVFNFPPARIFMGDSGSLLLGFTLAALAVSHRPRASDVLSVMGVPVMLFLLPILDTGLVTITRLLRGQSPAQGGADHTSHRLIAFGLNERQAVLALYGVGVISGVLGAALEALDYDLSLALIPVALIALSLLTAYLGRLKVVTSYNSKAGNISRLMLDLTYKRRLLEMVLDFFVIGLSYYLAFWTVSGFHLDATRMELVLASVPVALAGAYISFFVFGVYRDVWRYVGIEDLARYGRAVVGAVALAAAILLIFSSVEIHSPVTFLLYGMFLLLGLASSRASFTLLDRVYGRQQGRAEKLNVLIYGAEDAGEITLQWIERNPGLGYNPVGFLDDDPLKWGSRIHGVPVLGGCEQLETILADREVDGVILSSPAALENGPASDFMAACRSRGIWVKALRLDFELVE